jgi:hypothetical protein
MKDKLWMLCEVIVGVIGICAVVIVVCGVTLGIYRILAAIFYALTH